MDGINQLKPVASWSGDEHLERTHRHPTCDRRSGG